MDSNELGTEARQKLYGILSDRNKTDQDMAAENNVICPCGNQGFRLSQAGGVICRQLYMKGNYCR